MANSEIPLTPKQHKMIFELSDVSEVFYGGQAGGGKSEGLLAFMLYRRMTCPCSVGLALRRTFPELEKSLIRKSYKFFKAIAKYNEAKKTWHFNNGSIQEFGYCQNEKDVYQYQSAEYDDICFDELTHFTKFQYLYMLSRLRSAGEWKTLVRSASNPGNTGQKWVKERFVDPAKNQVHKITDEDGLVKSLFFLPAALSDNTLMSADKQAEYRSWLNVLPETEKKQLKEGIWDEMPIEGAFFAKEIEQARAAGRITRVPYVSGIPVDTYWDLGIAEGNETAIWMIQSLRAGEVRVIDYYENSGEGLPHYAKILRDKPYIYGSHFMPHDVEIRELGPGISRREQAQALGIKPIETVQRPRDGEAVAAGIEAGRNIMTRCYFDAEKCKNGIETLKNYHREWDEKNQVFRTKAVHDWASNGADAWRTFAMGFKERLAIKKKPKPQKHWMAA